MSRRLSAALIAAAALVPGAGVFTSTASAVDCFTWTDPTGDSAAVLLAQTGVATGDPGLDIKGVTLDSSGGDLTIAVSINDLADKALKGPGGDRYAVRFVAGAGKAVALTMNRDATGAKTVGWSVDGVAKTPAPVVVYDNTANTVTATIALSDFTTATGVAAGAPLRAMWAEARNMYGSPTVGSGVWDIAYAPDWYVHTLGTPCGAPRPEPVHGTPLAGCNVLTDGTGDGKMAPPVVSAPGVESPENDQDLDVTGVVGETSAEELRFYVRVAKLATLPARGNGHTFEVGFTTPGNKVISMDAGELDSTTSTVFTGRPRVFLGSTDKTANAAARARFDRTNSLVFFAVDRASVETIAGESLPAGTTLSSVYAESKATVGGVFWPADEAPNAVDAELVYRIGNNGCFRPPASKLVSLAASTVQYGDQANVTAKLTNDDGEALAGKTVRFAVGSDAVTATTDAAGVARTKLGTSKSAGTHTMAVTFAGDSTADDSSATAPFVVVLEKTRLTLSVVKRGSARTVTATLKDDDGRALSRQKVNWYVNGKKVSTATTNTAGQVVLKTAKPTQTVKAEFLTVSGKYLTSKASAKV